RLSVRPLFPHRTSHYHALYSFPTRRSSDLRPIFENRASGHARARGGDAGLLRAKGVFPARDRLRFGRRERLPSDRRGARPCGGRDRKSTRLNSSHVSISYAVFCLKKKKNA